MSKQKRQLKKKIDRQKRVKVKLAKKLNFIRENRKLEKELEEIRKLHESEVKPENDTQHQFAD